MMPTRLPFEHQAGRTHVGANPAALLQRVVRVDQALVEREHHEHRMLGDAGARSIGRNGNGNAALLRGLDVDPVVPDAEHLNHSDLVGVCELLRRDPGADQEIGLRDLREHFGGVVGFLPDGAEALRLLGKNDLPMRLGPRLHDEYAVEGIYRCFPRPHSWILVSFTQRSIGSCASLSRFTACFASRHSCSAFFSESAKPQDVLGDIRGNHDHAVIVSENNVARLDPDAAAVDGDVERVEPSCAKAPMRAAGIGAPLLESPAAEHRKVRQDLPMRSQIAVRAVHDHTRASARVRADGEVDSPRAQVRLDDDVAGLAAPVPLRRTRSVRSFVWEDSRA